MTDKLKYILLGFVIAIIFYYLVYVKKTDEKIKSQIIVDDYKILPGSNYSEISDLKSFYNVFINENFIEENTMYNANLKQFNDIVLKDTIFYNPETGELDKVFLNDLANICRNIYNLETEQITSNLTLDIIQKGDKSKNVELLQNILNYIFEKEYKNLGAYDSETYIDAMHIFKNTSFLINEKLGALSIDKILNFNTIINNLKQLK